MDLTHLSTIAGMISTVLFVSGTVPMLHKAWTTRDLGSYSLTNLVLSTVGNAIYWIYVASLPLGPIWLRHGVYTISTVTMLVWYLRQRHTGLGTKHAPTHP